MPLFVVFYEVHCLKLSNCASKFCFSCGDILVSWSSRHLWLPSKGILVFFQAYVDGPGTCLCNSSSVRYSAGRAQILQQSCMFRLSFKMFSADPHEVPNTLAILLMVILLLSGMCSFSQSTFSSVFLVKGCLDFLPSLAETICFWTLKITQEVVFFPFSALQDLLLTFLKFL